MECTTPGMHPNGSYGLWVIMMTYVASLIITNAPHWHGMLTVGKCVCELGQGVYGNSILSAHFLVNIKLFLKSQFSPSVTFDSLRPHGLQHTTLPCPSPTPRAYSNSCHPTISSSVIPFSSCHQSFPASGSFPMSQFFTSGGQSIGISAPASVLPMNIQDWFLLGWSGCISLRSKGLSRVFSNTTVQKHNFFSAQLSL